MKKPTSYSIHTLPDGKKKATLDADFWHGLRGLIMILAGLVVISFIVGTDQAFNKKDEATAADRQANYCKTKGHIKEFCPDEKPKTKRTVP